MLLVITYVVYRPPKIERMNEQVFISRWIGEIEGVFRTSIFPKCLFRYGPFASCSERSLGCNHSVRYYSQGGYHVGR